MRFFFILLVLLALIGGGYYAYITYVDVPATQPGTDNNGDEGGVATDDNSKQGTAADDSAGAATSDGSGSKPPAKDPKAEAERKQREAWQADIARVAAAFKANQYYEAYVLADALLRERLPADLKAEADRLFSRSQQAYWMTRNIVREPWADQEKITWLKFDSGAEWYVDIESENNNTVTLRTKTGSTMGFPRTKIEDRKQFTREEFSAREAVVLNKQLAEAAGANNETRNEKYYAAVEHAWANGLTDQVGGVVDKSLQAAPKLGWWVYQNEAKKILQRLMYHLAKNRDGTHRAVKELLSTLYYRYRSGGFLEEAETLVFGETGKNADYAGPAPDRADPVVATATVLATSGARLGDEGDADASAGDAETKIPAPAVGSDASFKDLLAEAKRYRDDGDSYFRKADPDNNSRGDATAVSRNINLAVAYYTAARDLLQRALPLATEERDLQRVQAELREVRRLVSISRKMKRFE